MAAWHRRPPGGFLVIAVHAQPGARRTEVAGLHGDALKIRVAAPASEGRANDALVEFIAGRLGVARRDVHLVAGGHSREKLFEIRDAAARPEALLAKG